MPLVRKPGAQPAAAVNDPQLIMQALASSNSDERWAAARAAATIDGTDAALARAASSEEDARVRAAMLTSLAACGTPVAIAALLDTLKSNRAALRSAALDALRMVDALPAILVALLADADPDVRILSCDLARSLPALQASALMCEVLERDTEANVCAGAIDVLAEVGGVEALVSLGSCAARFSDTPFLLFAIASVEDQIKAMSASPRD